MDYDILEKKIKVIISKGPSSQILQNVVDYLYETFEKYSWVGIYIVKGDNVRDEKYGKFKQYRKLSRIVLDSRYYCDSTFSWGDNYIQECADGTGKTGHLPMWRQVGTNHHIEKVTQDIASFYAS